MELVKKIAKGSAIHINLVYIHISITAQILKGLRHGLHARRVSLQRFALLSKMNSPVGA